MGQSYKDLVVWKKSMGLVMQVYRVSRKFPKEETYGLTSQMRRSAVSVPSNIAEGSGRRSSGEFRQFLIQARGSLLELETQLQIAENLDYLKTQQAEELTAMTGEVGRMLNGLLDYLNRKKQ